MIFTETPLAGAWVIDVDRRSDDRGFFGRTYCAEEFKQHGLEPRVVQCNVSFNARRGTLRGMHYQLPPMVEIKLVRCTQGAIYDSIVDLRSGSKTFGQWFGAELSAENRRALYVPAGFAHGFQTLTDNAEVFYQMSEFYSPGHARGFHHADPSVGILWPLPVTVISEADQAYDKLPR